MCKFVFFLDLKVKINEFIHFFTNVSSFLATYMIIYMSDSSSIQDLFVSIWEDWEGIWAKAWNLFLGT